MNIVVRATIAASVSIVAATWAMLGVEWVMPTAMQAHGAPQPGARAPALSTPTPFDRFVGVSDLTDAAGPASRACGFSGSLQRGGTVFWLREPPETFSINLASPSDSPTVFRFSASADAVHAFADSGVLYLQTGHRNRLGFDGRVFVLNEAGEPVFSGPLLQRGRIAVGCDDAEQAASLLNAAFTRSGAQTDPVRAGVRAFTIADGDVETWLPRLDAFIQACTPPSVIEHLPADQRFVLDAEYDEGARFGAGMGHHMSGELRAGSIEPMVYITLTTLDAGGGYARLETLRIPFSWHDVLHDGERLSVVYRSDDLEVINHIIEADGSRSDGVSSGPIRSASMPCADPETAATILSQLHSGPRPARPEPRG